MLSTYRIGKILFVSPIKEEPWYGYDFDGTLMNTEDESPIYPVVSEVKRRLERGEIVKVVTARASSDGTVESTRAVLKNKEFIREWCLKHIGQALDITCQKDKAMLSLTDDKAIHVQNNRGLPDGWTQYD